MLRLAVTLEQCWHRVPGGTAAATLRTVAALEERDDVELVGVAARHGGPPPEPYWPDVAVWQHRLPRRALYKSWQRLAWPPVQRATGPVDAVWASGVVVPPRSAPLVVSLYDFAPLHHPEHHPRHALGFFHRAYELARTRADLVTCISRTTMAEAVERGFAPDRLRHVPLGVTPRPVTADQVAEVRRRHDLGERYVLWVGTVEPRKNLPVLVEAFAGVARPGLRLALAGPDGWNEDLRALVGDRDDVRALGFVDDDDLAALYAGAAVFAYPSLLEGFGLPVLEAMAQGAPVVTAAGTSTRSWWRAWGPPSTRETPTPSRPPWPPCSTTTTKPAAGAPPDGPGPASTPGRPPRRR